MKKILSVIKNFNEAVPKQEGQNNLRYISLMLNMFENEILVTSFQQSNPGANIK